MPKWTDGGGAVSPRRREGTTGAVSSTAGALRHRLGRDSLGEVVDGAGRTGLTARGVLYLIVAVLAVQMAFGTNDHPADRQGALRSLAGNPFGEVLLIVLAFGFGAYSLWRLAQAAIGYRSETDRRKRTAKRAASLGKAAAYATAGVTAATTFLGNGSRGDSNEQSKTWTARLLAMPAGPALVTVAGVVLVGAGLYLAWRGISRKFEEHQKTGQMPEGVQRAAAVLGLVGYTARGIVVGLLGLLMIRSAYQRDPSEAQGIDGTLRTIAVQPYGRALLLLAAAGLAAFGLHSFVEARYRET